MTEPTLKHAYGLYLKIDDTRSEAEKIAAADAVFKEEVHIEIDGMYATMTFDELRQRLFGPKP